MDKLEFIARQLAKAQNKKYEHYVVNRVWNRLDDFRVKFVTQQFVSRPEGRAMTDMYFPQLGIHIEVDEGFHKKQIDADQLREADIINATGHEVMRVDVTKDVEHINGEINSIVEKIKGRIASMEDFEPWDMEAEMNPQTYIDKGYIDIEDDVAFRTMADAATCFGRDYSRGLQLGYIPHPVEPNKYLWFPKLYENEKWSNSLSADEQTITEFCKVSELFIPHIDKNVEQATRIHSRIVFARVKSPLGDLMYRFKGEYKIDLEATNYEAGLIYRRIGTRVKTYPHPQGDKSPTPKAEKGERTIGEFYAENVVRLSVDNQLKLAALILNGLTNRQIEANPLEAA